MLDDTLFTKPKSFRRATPAPSALPVGQNMLPGSPLAPVTPVSGGRRNSVYQMSPEETRAAFPPGEGTVFRTVPQVKNPLNLYDGPLPQQPPAYQGPQQPVPQPAWQGPKQQPPAWQGPPNPMAAWGQNALTAMAQSYQSGEAKAIADGRGYLANRGAAPVGPQIIPSLLNVRGLAAGRTAPQGPMVGLNDSERFSRTAPIASNSTRAAINAQNMPENNRVGAQTANGYDTRLQNPMAPNLLEAQIAQSRRDAERADFRMSPGGEQMQGRFGKGSPIGPGSRYGDTGLSWWDDGGGGGSSAGAPLAAPDAKATAFAQAEAVRRGRRPSGGKQTPEGAAQVEANRKRMETPEYKARVEANRDERRRRRDEGVATDDQKFNRAVRKGMNPMSDKAKALFPEQVANARTGGKTQNPMVNPLDPKAPNTIENQQARAAVRAGLTKGIPATDTTPEYQADPLLASLNLPEDVTPHQVDSALGNLDPKTVPSPESLRNLRKYMSTFRSEGEGKHQFEGSANAASWGALVELPEDATDEQLQAWWGQHRTSKVPPAPTTYPGPQGGYPGY